MTRTPNEAPKAEPTTREIRSMGLAAYAIAGMAYIALGFVAKEVFAWWVYGVSFALLALCCLPELCRRLFR